MSSLQEEIEDRGSQIFHLVDQNPESIFSKAGFYQRMMAFSMRDEHFKVQMFRFVDVLAALNSPRDIVQHLNEYFADMRNGSVPFLRTGLRAARILPWVTAPVLRWNVSGMARQFIAGRDPDDVMKTLRKRRKERIGFTVDLLGEAVVSEQEADEYAARCFELLEGLAERTRGWTDSLGKNAELFPVVNVSVKISAFYSQMNPADPEDAIAHLAPKLRPILRRAREVGAFINFDMESYAHKNTTLELFRRLFTEPEFRDWPHAGIVIQAYLRDAEKDLRDLIDWARERGTRFTVRLVKGAYWDYEKIKAAQNGWRVPVYLQKPESDANFEVCTRVLLDNESIVTAAFGSHNVRSIAHAQAYAQQLGIEKSRFEFQLLYGMAGPIKRALVEMGYRVREYSPVGELLPGMSYLVRRLLENTSNEGFLKAKFSDNASAAQLLRDPKELVGRLYQTPSTGSVSQKRPTISVTAQSHNGQSLDTPPGDTYENSPLVNFVHRTSQERMQTALHEMRAKLGQKYPIVIDGRKIWTDNLINSINPTSPTQVVGAVAEAKVEHAEDAVKAARKAFEHWCRVSVDHRAELLERVASIMDRRRFELSALEVYEVGKPWAEADGDIREAIDFLLFYAQQMRLRGLPRLTQHVPGEESYQHYWPRGVALVIAPWNFPMAILTGMVSAALVTGNTVIMKPAEQSAVCGAMLMEMFEEAGIPPGVLNFLPGKGRVIGQHLVDHKDVHMIAFTGSREVGLRIWESAGQTRPGQLELKRVVCEMGGKNAVIVDSDADLDEAIVDTIYSAFGYQGQKCSACSRLIVLEENYDRVIKRLVEAAASLRVGNPETPGMMVGPVIDETAYRRQLEVIEIGKKEATLAFQGAVPAEGFFVPPTIFTGVTPEMRLAREEIFGPVLSVMKVRDLDEAIRVANDTDYALTAGFFSRSPANIERVKAELVAGNVYINRSCTGAVVGRHPFGGFKMSGGGTKAGGGDYLLQFLVPRVVTENIMRHGFAPDTTPEFRAPFGAKTLG
jgi:RHH-type proline utilization regulon transcriptional repressor/proline dehydrogenase/delta 1-pyrroline-5-carboxylate dehydrogenase